MGKADVSRCFPPGISNYDRMRVNYDWVRALNRERRCVSDERHYFGASLGVVLEQCADEQREDWPGDFGNDFWVEVHAFTI